MNRRYFEVIWIVKDGQRVQVGACTHGHHDRPLKFLPQFLTVMSNAAIVDKIANDAQNLGVNWPVMFDERALVQSQAQEQGPGRRRHDESDIDGKFIQIDVSSSTEKLFLSHYHNQLAPSCTSVRFRREYWRWNHLLYCNSKNANLK